MFNGKCDNQNKLQTRIEKITLIRSKESPNNDLKRIVDDVDVLFVSIRTTPVKILHLVLHPLLYVVTTGWAKYINTI